MRIMYQRVIFGTSDLLEPACGGIHRLLLDVKSINVTVFSYCFGEKFGVMAVPHRKIHRRVALAKVRKNKFFL